MIWDRILDIFRRAREVAILPPTLNFHDRRKTAAQGHGPKQAWRVGSRPWSKVTGICLHQTACVLGERPERWDTVGAHIGITRSGKVIWLHDFNRIVAHGNGWNAGTVGIEIDGLYAGVEGDASTVWNDPSTARREVGMDLEKTNVNGGAIALGHPMGATGTKLTIQLLHEMKRRGSKYGLVTMCIGGGMGAAGIFENLQN